MTAKGAACELRRYVKGNIEMMLATSKKSYSIQLSIGLDTEEDFRAFRQILTQWLDDHSGNSNSVTHQKAKSIARELYAVMRDGHT